MDAYTYKMQATGANQVSQNKYGVTNAAYQVASINASRRAIRFANEGNTTIWFGASSNVLAGASAYNFAGLESGSNLEVEHYSGPVWARLSGVSAGASMDAEWLGVIDIG